MISARRMINGNNLDQPWGTPRSHPAGPHGHGTPAASRLSGLGHLEKSGSGEQMVYTYDELRSLGFCPDSCRKVKGVCS